LQSALKKSDSRIVLHPKRSPTVLQLVAFTAILALALWVAIQMAWAAYVCAVICAAGICATTVRLFRRGNYLMIEGDGFTVCNFFLRTSVKWSVVDKFFIVVVKRRGLRPRRIVGFNYIATYNRSQAKRNFFVRPITECEGALSDSYEGKSPRELSDLMNARLQRARKNRGAAFSPAQQAALLREDFGLMQ